MDAMNDYIIIMGHGAPRFRGSIIILCGRMKERIWGALAEKTMHPCTVVIGSWKAVFAVGSKSLGSVAAVTL